MEEKILIICPKCQTKYRVTVQGKPKEKVSFPCKKCETMIEIIPGAEKPPEPTNELVRLTCEKCGTEFVKNVEDDSTLCYQCRIDQLLTRKKKEEAEPPKPKPEAEKTASRYTFRNPDGLELGPIKLRTVSVLVNEKRIIGNELVSKDGGAFQSLKQFPELTQFFPELSDKEEEVIEETTISLEDSETSPGTEPKQKPKEIKEQKIAPEPKIYFLKLKGGRELGPVRKTTIIDLLECGFLIGEDQISKDQKQWNSIQEDLEFKQFVPTEDAEVVDLVESVEE